VKSMTYFRRSWRKKLRAWRAKIKLNVSDDGMNIDNISKQWVSCYWYQMGILRAVCSFKVSQLYNWLSWHRDPVELRYNLLILIVIGYLACALRFTYALSTQFQSFGLYNNNIYLNNKAYNNAYKHIHNFSKETYNLIVP
jgi:hypothetical protein